MRRYLFDICIIGLAQGAVKATLLRCAALIGCDSNTPTRVPNTADPSPGESSVAGRRHARTTHPGSGGHRKTGTQPKLKFPSFYREALANLGSHQQRADLAGAQRWQVGRILDRPNWRALESVPDAAAGVDEQA